MPLTNGSTRLSPRERDVVRCFSRGLTYAQTAMALDVSINTIRAHVRKLYDKLEAADKVEAIFGALRAGCIAFDQP